MSAAPQVVVITGLSGAGRSSALRVLEDAGFFCVDNLPPGLAPELLQLVRGEGRRMEQLDSGDGERDPNGIEGLVGRRRRKLEAQCAMRPIETVRGLGYLFTERCR